MYQNLYILLTPNIVIEIKKLIITLTLIKKASKNLKKIKEMIRMCLYLINSQYKGIAEVEYLLSFGFNMTEEKIIAMQNNREEIDKALELAEFCQEMQEMGL